MINICFAEMIIAKMKEIDASNGSERKKLTEEFQKKIWNDESRPDNPVSEILSELAYDLDFYEPDEKLRSEDSSFYGDDEVESRNCGCFEKSGSGWKTLVSII